jgi:hypothetical protein
LAIVRIGGDAYRHPEDVFSARLRERLSEGIADYAAMRKLAGAVDAFVLGILREAGVPPRRGIDALGAFEPQPPAYFEPVAELIQRCAQVPRAASRLPHAVDGLVHGRPANLVPPLTGQLVRTIHAFLARQSGLPAALLTELALGPHGAMASTAVREAGDEQPVYVPTGDGPEEPAAATDGGDPTLFGDRSP